MTPSINEDAGSTPAFTLTRTRTGQAQTFYLQAATGSGNAVLGSDYTVNAQTANNTAVTANNNVIAVSFAL